MDAARAYAGEVRDRLESLLGSGMIGVYLGGSLALGDFQGIRSDVDVAAVSAEPPPTAMKEAVVSALEHPGLPCPVRGMEFVLYSERAVRTPLPGGAFEINLNTGPAMHHSVSFDPSTEPSHWFVLDRAIYRDHGVALSGPPAGEVFAPVPRAWVLEALVQSLAWHREADRAAPNSVLNSCRAWRYLEEGRWSSKTDAAAWAGERATPEEAALVDAALARRHGRSIDPLPAEATDAFAARIQAAVTRAGQGQRRR
jgi:hypothetical protein